MIDYCVHTTHLIKLPSIHLLSPPVLALNLLSIQLPFSQETDDMYRVLGVFVVAKFFLNEFVAYDALFGWEMLSMATKNAAIQRDGWEEGNGDRLEACGLIAH